MPGAPARVRSLDPNLDWRKTPERPTSFSTRSNASSLTPLEAFQPAPSREENLYSGNR